MKAIIIGAGRGSRLMPYTEQEPKCFTRVHDKRILDWTLEAFYKNGIEDICFIGGYHMHCVERDYPQFHFFHNEDWQQNNILASLLYAENVMNEPFVCCYSDTLFSSDYIEKVVQNDSEIVLGVDTDWKHRYRDRTDHPTTDAEKVTFTQDTVTCVHRDISEEEAHGEFTGITKFTVKGADAFRAHYHAAKEKFAGKPFREAEVFEKAYLIHLYQDMIEAGTSFSFAPHHGQYIEIDTVQDYEYAHIHWPSPVAA